MSNVLCRLSDIPDGGAKSVLARGRRIAVVRIGGSAYALEDRCPHFGGPLSQGTISISRHEIICPWHRFRFALENGACVASTGRMPVPTYAVRVENGLVLASIPPAAPPAVLEEADEGGEG